MSKHKRERFIPGYLDSLYLSGKQPNLKEPRGQIVEVKNGLVMPVQTCWNVKKSLPQEN